MDCYFLLSSGHNTIGQYFRRQDAQALVTTGFTADDFDIGFWDPKSFAEEFHQRLIGLRSGLYRLWVAREHLAARHRLASGKNPIVIPHLRINDQTRIAFAWLHLMPQKPVVSPDHREEKQTIS